MPQNFRNRITNENFTLKIILDRDFFKRKLFGGENLNIWSGMLRNRIKYYKKLTRGPNVWIKRTTCQNSRFRIISPVYARFPLELIFGHKTFICQTIFKTGLENICMKAIHSAMVHVKHAPRRCRKWSRCKNPISLMCVCSVPPSNTRSHDVIITNIWYKGRAICVDDGISKKINLYHRLLKLIHIRAHFPSNFSSIAVELNLKSDRVVWLGSCWYDR